MRDRRSWRALHFESARARSSLGPTIAALLVLIATLVFCSPTSAGSSSASPTRSKAGAHIVVGGRHAQLTLSAVQGKIIHLQLSPLGVQQVGKATQEDLALVVREPSKGKQVLQSIAGQRKLKIGQTQVTVSADPLSVAVNGPGGRVVQRLQFDKDTGGFSFLLGDGPILGLGEGGPQFDRRGSTYSMKSGQGVKDLKVDGARVPIPWLIGTSGWAMFVHTPRGSYDVTGKEGRFLPKDLSDALPLDIFIVASADPAEMMKDYAQLTGLPHLPPIWALGYQQSHRTLASREAVMSEAKTFREKKLSCDVFIYLGTGFCPSGWNTGHGSFTFNSRVFPDPEEMFRELHAQDLRIVLHVVSPPEHLYGSVNDTGAAAADENDAANVWAKHLEVFRLGVDGWWPDEGDRLDIQSRLVRNRLYWEGPQKERPNLRPYALHRNGYAGMQRYAWLWSGDINSTWETLAAQVPVGINTSLSGEPFWGTDTGGFYPTRDLTGELYVRWFQFSAFCPLFRSHGRAWKLRLPWGWNTGEIGPTEVNPDIVESALPDASELHNSQVEPICRKYLDLRYRLMPYLYSVVHQAHETGLPIMRALWLHYPDDPQAVARGDEYLWGRDMLVAPVVEKDATSRRLYLPRGQWYDFWAEDKVEGGREINRTVDLATLPLYVRAGAVLPMGPVKQYTLEKVEGPLSVTVYPGADGEFVLYEDDGLTFNYQKGDWSRLRMTWNNTRRTLTLHSENGPHAVAPLPRKVEVRLAGEKTAQTVEFTGKALSLSF